VAYIRKYRDSWRAEVQRHGHRATHVAPTKREAQAWAIKKEIELDALKGSKGRTFGQAVAHYETTVSTTKRGLEWEKRRFMPMVAYFGDETPLVQIDSEAIGKWRDWRLKTVSGSTVNREANLLRNLFSLARDEWRWIERSPFTGVRLPKENAPRHQVWTWQLIRRVLRAERTGKTAEVQQAFRVALHTGLRLSEVLSGKYDPARRVIDLERTKTGGRVSVPTVPRARRWLAVSFTVGANEASVLFSKLCAELLITGLTFHDSRASALTWLSRRVDVMTLARISRHKDLRILMNTYYRETAEQISGRL
jgi:integrase